MKWFEGSIAEAVTTSKQNNAVFVVFIDGKNEPSKVMSSAIDKPSLSKRLESNSFVSVKLESGSESHTQFTEIYKLVPVPSVFFIGQNGAPLEIVVGESGEENISSKLEAAIKKCIGSFEVPTEKCNEASSDRSSQPKENLLGKKVDCESSMSPEKMNNDSEPLSLQNKETEPTPSSSKISPSTSSEKLNREQLIEIIEKKKEARQIQEEKEEKEKEIQRRKDGQNQMEVKRKQQDRELQELRIERLKEKQLEKEAKQKVLEQIAQDRAERAARMAGSQMSSAPSTSSSASENPTRSSPPIDVNSARIQFKLPDGETRTHTFPAETTLAQVRKFIDNNITLPFREYQMATTFPRREFTHRDINLDLRELQLLPSAAILIMPLQGAMSISGPGWSRMFIDMFWDMMSPLFTLSRYIQGLIFGGGSTTAPPPSEPTPSPPPASERPVQQRLVARSVVRKRGNIHSLAENDGPNDDNNTWNGNSTQQM